MNKNNNQTTNENQGLPKKTLELLRVMEEKNLDKPTLQRKASATSMAAAFMNIVELSSAHSGAGM